MGAIQNTYILRIGVIMLAIALLGGVAMVLVSLLASRIAAGTARDMRRSVFSRIEHFSIRNSTGCSTASLITRCTNDITQSSTFDVRLRLVQRATWRTARHHGLEKIRFMAWVIALAA
jgi:ATP-binding cassette subfamily B protein